MPPPVAVRWVMTRTPNRSSPRFSAAIAPLIANAKVPRRSTRTKISCSIAVIPGTATPTLASAWPPDRSRASDGGPARTRRIGVALVDRSELRQRRAAADREARRGDYLLPSSSSRMGIRASISGALIRLRPRRKSRVHDLVPRQGLVEDCIESFGLVEHDEVLGIVDHDELVARDGGDEPVPGGDEGVAWDLALHVGDDDDDARLDLAEVGSEVG